MDRREAEIKRWMRHVRLDTSFYVPSKSDANPEATPREEFSEVFVESWKAAQYPSETGCSPCPRGTTARTRCRGEFPD